MDEVLFYNCDIVKGDTDTEFISCEFCYRYETCKKAKEKSEEQSMKYINISPLDYWCEKGVGFEIKPVNDHTLSVKVTCGEKYRIREFDLNTFHFDTDYDKRVSQVIGSVIESMTDYVLGIEP